MSCIGSQLVHFLCNAKYVESPTMAAFPATAHVQLTGRDSSGDGNRIVDSENRFLYAAASNLLPGIFAPKQTALCALPPAMLPKLVPGNLFADQFVSKELIKIAETVIIVLEF